MTEPSFKKHQYDFTAHLRDPEHNPAPEGIEDRRIGIYRDLLYNNVEGFIANGFPVLRSIYSDDDWHKMVRDFFARHQCTTPYFLEISQEFLDYLQSEREPQAEDPQGLLELAHYEWVELALMVADDNVDLIGIDPNGELRAGHPVLSPLAWPLAYQYPVHRMGPDYLPAAPPDQPTYLVVYRNRNDEVRFLEINPVTARLINLLQDNPEITGELALDQIVQEINHPQPELVIEAGVSALQELQRYGIVLGVAK
ncbi:MAG: putative DNA-binding domain-containing protein [Gammaproteobacteria bacterium]|nr:putative DNA-binding domain-containing protein [Gammaproteobacteria bacterium]